MKFALAGNPNCGKTTLFNSLTGSTAHVGNWPGVTVDKREGTYRYKKSDEKLLIVDLPGIYSLSPYTPEEVISRNFILDEKPECVIDVVDATNLERNLYLTTQLLEIDVPVIVALNMMDVLEKNGDMVDAGALEAKLGVPVVAVSALKGTGLDELMERGYKAAQEPRKGATVLTESDLGHLIGDVKIALDGQNIESPLFHAVKLVEGDELESKAHAETVKMVDDFKGTFDDGVFGNDFEALVADARYSYISKHFSSALKKKEKEKLSMSDKADKVLTNRWAGLPIFIVILFLIFHLTFSENLFFLNGFGDGWMPTLEELGLDTENFWVSLLACVYDGTVFSPGCIINNLWNDIIVGNIFGLITGAIENIEIEWLVGFLNDGVIEGLAAVLSFLPQILVLFLFFSILEDSGYMARVAFILDRIFSKFGLSGRAFMPMIMGFGCSIPAMINTRTLSDPKERTATIRVIPFFSCGAKLPILTAIAGGIVQYFGIGNADFITFGMYLLGIVTAIVSVLLMRNTTMRGKVPPFIMELPPYHMPRFKSLMVHLWDKCKHFVKKAFTIILASTVLIWFISHFSFSWQFLADEEINESILAGIGMLLQPLFTPLGFGAQLGEYGWVFVVAALTGLIAKENVIATFATLASCIGAQALGLDEEAIAAVLEDEEGVDAAVYMIMATDITIPGLISFIAFNMTTVPCFAAIGTAKAELPDKKSFNWTLVFWLGTSYIVGTIVYTVGSWWWTLFIWLAVIALLCVCIWQYNRKHPVVDKAVA